MATKKAASKKAVAAPAEVAVAAKKAPAKAAAKKTASKSASKPESAAAPSAPAASAAKPAPSHHDIQVRAYLLWEQHGKHHGQHEYFWEQAERELRG